ncbi:Uncharacterised protein [Mycobacteroides abscessus]|nr:Uncharacterised protein [Mycobacteroides abscessus]
MIGDALLLFECEGDGCARVGEFGNHGVNPGDRDGYILVDEIADDHHRVIALLDRLRVEPFGQLWQIGVVEIDRDGDVLLGRSELVADLIVQQCEERRGGARVEIGGSHLEKPSVSRGRCGRVG